MDNPVQPGIGRGRVLRRRSRRAGMQHIFGAAERITRARAALGSLDCTISHRGQLREDPMTLSFPNKSRAFDATRRAVRFWGYDSAMEVAFFVTEDALKRVQPDVQPDEAGLLRAFDSNRDLICTRAAKIYRRGRKGSYDLVGADF